MKSFKGFNSCDLRLPTSEVKNPFWYIRDAYTYAYILYIRPAFLRWMGYCVCVCVYVWVCECLLCYWEVFSVLLSFLYGSSSFPRAHRHTHHHHTHIHNHIRKHIYTTPVLFFAQVLTHFVVFSSEKFYLLLIEIVFFCILMSQLFALLNSKIRLYWMWSFSFVFKFFPTGIHIIYFILRNICLTL